VNGMELANGYFELTDVAEQTKRFQNDQKQRAQNGLTAMQADLRLLAALESGLPSCAGVALGFDRLVMLATHKQHIEEILPFAHDRA
ncbi:MAG TPA: amino acid--tRNA ligase-related protein, partial [Pseudidiomarina sp.]|nr:amino acid--tRNA ligase-related protein [Pseudidiomarina sp.]